jgi:hypothetical protein
MLLAFFAVMARGTRDGEREGWKGKGRGTDEREWAYLARVQWPDTLLTPPGVVKHPPQVLIAMIPRKDTSRRVNKMRIESSPDSRALYAESYRE